MKFYKNPIVNPIIFPGKVEPREETGRQDVQDPGEAQGGDARTGHQERPGQTVDPQGGCVNHESNMQSRLLKPKVRISLSWPQQMQQTVDDNDANKNEEDGDTHSEAPPPLDCVKTINSRLMKIDANFHQLKEKKLSLSEAKFEAIQEQVNHLLTLGMTFHTTLSSKKM